MASRKITELSPIGSVTASDLLLIVDETADPPSNFNVTVEALGEFIGVNYAQLQGNATGNINMGTYALYVNNLLCYTEGNIVIDSPLAMSGNSLYLNSGSGSGGGTVYMDQGNIAFSGINGDYGDGGYGSVIQTGSFNNGYGASGGLSLVCSVGVELNWQAGWLSASYNNGEVFQNVNMYQTGFNMQGNPINLNAGLGSGGGGMYLDGGSIYPDSYKLHCFW